MKEHEVMLRAFLPDGLHREVAMDAGTDVFIRVCAALIGAGFRVRVGHAASSLEDLHDHLLRLEQGGTFVATLLKDGIAVNAFVDGGTDGHHAFRELDFDPREVNVHNVATVTEVLRAAASSRGSIVTLRKRGGSSALGGCDARWRAVVLSCQHRRRPVTPPAARGSTGASKTVEPMIAATRIAEAQHYD